MKRLDNILEMPREVCSNEPKLTIIGFEELMIEIQENSNKPDF